MRLLEGMFAKQERLALGFLLCVGLLGLGFQWLRLDRQPASSYVPPAMVSVNRASAAELVALPGIGPVLAERILKDRRLHGRYLTLRDLSRVKGITPKTLARLERYLRFD